jgi:hypothetical protein
MGETRRERLKVGRVLVGRVLVGGCWWEGCWWERVLASELMRLASLGEDPREKKNRLSNCHFSPDVRIQ